MQSRFLKMQLHIEPEHSTQQPARHGMCELHLWEYHQVEYHLQGKIVNFPQLIIDA